MSDLSAKVCTACRGDEPTLKENEIEEYMNKVDSGWESKSNPDRILRTIEFEDFKEALSFVNKVGEIAEDQGHHPNINIHDYNMVDIELYTHKIGGLHENDFIMAAKIDKLV